MTEKIEKISKQFPFPILDDGCSCWKFKTEVALAALALVHITLENKKSHASKFFYILSNIVNKCCVHVGPGMGPGGQTLYWHRNARASSMIMRLLSESPLKQPHVYVEVLQVLRVINNPPP